MVSKARREVPEQIPFRKVYRSVYDTEGNETETTGWMLNSEGGGRWYSDPHVEWRDNLPFTATLTYQQLIRSGHVAHTQWTDTAGTVYVIFLGDLLKHMQQHGIAAGGVITGQWIGCKRGTAYAIRPYVVGE